MKTKAGILACICAAATFCGPARAQITLTVTDVDSILAVGHSLANKIDKVTTSLNIGAHGSTSWNFSALRSDSSQTLTSVQVSGTPFVAQFPGADHVFQTDLNVLFNNAVIPATGYLYFHRSTNLLNLGEGATALSGFATLVAINYPADVFYGLPSTFGTTWTSTYNDTARIVVFGSLQSSTPAAHNASYIVDAFGPMTLPDNSVHDALRIKKTDSTASGKSVSYLFLARDGASVQVTAFDPSGPDVGTIQIQSFPSWNGQVVSLPLPIELASFNALPATAGDGVLLKWSTISEVNNYGFEIQRSASATEGFVSLPGAFIPGHGTTTLPRDYSYTDAGVTPGTWNYRLKQMDLDGSVHFSDAAKIVVRENGSPREVPSSFSLAQNYPNPFNPVTTISYSITSRTNVELAVYDLLGQRVALLVSGVQDEGSHQVRFDGSALSSGVYIYRLRAGASTDSKKLSLLR